MLVMIKSAPDAPESRKAFKLACYMEADLVLIQNAVYLLQEKEIKAFKGKVYFLEEDTRMRGLSHETANSIKGITYDELIDLLTGDEAVQGAY